MDKRPPEPVSDEDGVEAPGDVDTDAGCVAKAETPDICTGFI